ncbi:MAG: chromosomal replication initiator protein DnaA [Acidobacteriia bacterium]|nr:chromosomal replication initiator protein DnaA [Terriglobia bacterium]
MNPWNLIQATIRESMTAESYRNWVEPVTFSHVGRDRVLHIEAPNSDVRRWLEAECAGQILAISARQGHNLRSVSIGIRPDLSQPIQGTLALDADERQFNPGYTFDRFVTGSCNEFARSACEGVAVNPSGTLNPLYVHAQVGMGKTHLLHAIANRALALDSRRKIVYTSAEGFMNEMVKSLRFNDFTSFHERFRGPDMLLVDDIQILGNKQAMQDEFFHTFEALYQNGKQIVLTSDSKPEAVPGLVNRLKSRFLWGEVADIQAPDLETKMAILETKSSEAKVALPDQVRFYLASRVHSSIRELEGVLNRMIARAQFVNGDITMGIAESVLRNARQRAADRPSIDRIKREVAASFGIAVDALSKKSNARRIAQPRQLAMYLCRELTGASLKEIARSFGKDHSTVLYSVRIIGKKIEKDRTLRSTLESLESSLK